MRSKGCRNQQELEALLGVQVLAVVPVMVPAIERMERRRGRNTLILLAAAAAIAVGVLVVMFAL